MPYVVRRPGSTNYRAIHLSDGVMRVWMFSKPIAATNHLDVASCKSQVEIWAQIGINLRTNARVHINHACPRKPQNNRGISHHTRAAAFFCVLRCKIRAKRCTNARAISTARVLLQTTAGLPMTCAAAFFRTLRCQTLPKLRNVVQCCPTWSIVVHCGPVWPIVAAMRSNAAQCCPMLVQCIPLSLQCSPMLAKAFQSLHMLANASQ